MQIVSGDITRDITGEIVYLLLCVERRLGGCVRL